MADNHRLLTITDNGICDFAAASPLGQANMDLLKDAVDSGKILNRAIVDENIAVYGKINGFIQYSSTSNGKKIWVATNPGDPSKTGQAIEIDTTENVEANKGLINLFLENPENIDFQVGTYTIYTKGVSLDLCGVDWPGIHEQE